MNLVLASFIKKEGIYSRDCENQKYQMSFKWKTSTRCVVRFRKQDCEEDNETENCIKK